MGYWYDWRYTHPPSFPEHIRLEQTNKDFSKLQGNIVSALQAGCFFEALASFLISDPSGKKPALLIADSFFIFGSVIQVCSGLHATSLSLLYVGRVIGGVGVELISAVVPFSMGENADKKIRGRCIGAMQLFNVTGIMLSYSVNYGTSKETRLGALQWRIPIALQTLPGVHLFVGILLHNESHRWLAEKSGISGPRCTLSHVRNKPVDDPLP